MKYALLLFSFCSWAFGQTLPTYENALHHLKTDKNLHQKLKTELGYDFSKLKIVDHGEFSYSYTDEGYDYSYKLPKDRVSMAFTLETPKDNNGLYKSCTAFIDYRRSKCDGGGCVILQDWRYYRGGVGTVMEKGYKEFDQSEVTEMALDYFKKRKFITVFDNYIEISQIQHPDVITNYADGGGSASVSLSIKGTSVSLTPDRSRILSYHEDRTTKFTFYFSDKGGDWSGDSIAFYMTKDGIDYEYALRSFSEKEVEEVYFQTMKEVGFSGVYQKRNKVTPSSNGMIEAFRQRNEALFSMVVAKGGDLTTKDLLPFMYVKNGASSATVEQEVGDYLKKDQVNSVPTVLVGWSLESTPYFSLHKSGGGLSGGAVEKEFRGKVYVQGLFDSKGGKITPDHKKAGQLLKKRKTELIWVWKNENWYLKNSWGFRLVK